jgi:hypothetical protein
VADAGSLRKTRCADPCTEAVSVVGSSGLIRRSPEDCTTWSCACFTFPVIVRAKTERDSAGRIVHGRVLRLNEASLPDPRNSPAVWPKSPTTGSVKQVPGCRSRNDERSANATSPLLPRAAPDDVEWPDPSPSPARVGCLVASKPSKWLKMDRIGLEYGHRRPNPDRASTPARFHPISTEAHWKEAVGSSRRHRVGDDFSRHFRTR